jgi:hypothetical protein
MSQQNTNDLVSMYLSNVTVTLADNGAINYVIVNPTSENRFYRCSNRGHSGAFPNVSASATALTLLRSRRYGGQGEKSRGFHSFSLS